MPTSTAPSALLAEVRANPPAFLNVAQVAAILDRHVQAIYQQISKGNLPGVVRVGRSIRISTAAFLAFIDGEG